jgi:hypothetical protein
MPEFDEGGDDVQDRPARSRSRARAKSARPPLHAESVNNEYSAVLAKENEMGTIDVMFRHGKER